MQSKFLTSLSLLPVKALVTTFTWSTLPFYAAVQKPWRRLKLSRSGSDLVTTIDEKTGRKIYSRKPLEHFEHPYLSRYSFNEIVPLLDRSWPVLGERAVISEEVQTDPITGKVIKIDGKELKKVRLADDFHWWTVGEVLDRVDALARGLQQLGVKRGEKVYIYADNGFEWFCSSMALSRLNAVAISLLSILNDEGITHCINQCEARYLITSSTLLPKIDRLSGSFAQTLNVVYIGNKVASAKDTAKLEKTISNLKTNKGYQVISYDNVVEIGSKMKPVEFEVPHPDEVSVIQFTSGTSGVPKGVMLTHRNFGTGLHNMLRHDSQLDISLFNVSFPAYLPMAHIFGYMYNFLCLYSRARIGMCSSLTMLDSSPGHVPGQVGDFRLIKPELMPGVPLVLDRILKEVYRKLETRGPLAVPLFNYFLDYKIRWKDRGFDSPLLNRLLSDRVKTQFAGGKQLVSMFVGSAPLSERTQALIQEIFNVKMMQAYGSTEMTGACHITNNNSLTYGHCGVPLHSNRFYLEDWEEGGYSANDKPNPRGEVVVGGENISLGYYKMPQETEEAFFVDEQGTRWFRSGDIAELLPDGNLKIIDRRKDLMKLANGEYVSLGKIESGLRSSSPYVENICVCTNTNSNYVTAIISPNRKAMDELVKKLDLPSSLSLEQLCNHPAVVDYIQTDIEKTCTELLFAKKEMPSKITLVAEEWTPDNFLTAALKMRRKPVNEFYQEAIRNMFAETK